MSCDCEQWQEWVVWVPAVPGLPVTCCPLATLQLILQGSSDGRYLRALAVIYIRLTFRSMEVYQILEPLMKDYRKLRYREVGE